MKLDIKERLHLPEILPREGNFTTLVIKSDLLDKIKITQEEIKKYNITSEGNVVKWDIEKAEDIDIDFTELELKLIAESLEKLDLENKLTDYTFILYKKFKQ